MTPSEWLLNRFEAQVLSGGRHWPDGNHSVGAIRPLLSFHDDEIGSYSGYRWFPGLQSIYDIEELTGAYPGDPQ